MGLGKDILKRSLGVGFVKDMKQANEAAKAGTQALAEKDQMLEQAAALRTASQAGMANSGRWRCPAQR